MTQSAYLLKLCENNKDAVIIGSIGTITYDLKDIEHPNKILVKGAMGSVIGIGLGYALAQPEQKVIVVIGDGSYLMRMGSTATVLKYMPRNLEINIMKNNRYKSCGDQRNNFSSIEHLVPFNIVDVE